jgi:hypothetical protein
MYVLKNVYLNMKDILLRVIFIDIFYICNKQKEFYEGE